MYNAVRSTAKNGTSNQCTSKLRDTSSASYDMRAWAIIFCIVVPCSLYQLPIIVRLDANGCVFLHNTTMVDTVEAHCCIGVLVIEVFEQKSQLLD